MRAAMATATSRCASSSSRRAARATTCSRRARRSGGASRSGSTPASPTPASPRLLRRPPDRARHAFRATMSISRCTRVDRSRRDDRVVPGKLIGPDSTTAFRVTSSARAPGRAQVRRIAGRSPVHSLLATAHSSSGLGHRPLTAAARVRIPYGPFRARMDKGFRLGKRNGERREPAGSGRVFPHRFPIVRLPSRPGRPTPTTCGLRSPVAVVGL